jgi:hypothetical protein
MLHRYAYSIIFLLATSLSFAQSCPPTIPAAPTCPNSCASNTAANNDNVTTGNTQCHVSGNSNFGNYALNGGTLVVSGGTLNINNFDIGGTGSTILVTGGTLTINWRNLNSLGNLRVCGGTVNISGNNYNNGFNYNVATGATLNFSTTFNANGNMTITNRGTTNFNGNGSYGFNNSNNAINNAGTITGSNANWALASSSTVVNNTGSISIRDLAMNNGNYMNMGNGAALNIRNLDSNNQTNSFCVAAGGCANFNVSGTAQMNNSLTSSSGIRYCGATPTGGAGGGTGSATISCVACPVILPLTWLSFQGKAIQNTIYLQWTTSQEVNTSHFEVEYSKNGIDYQVLAKINTYNLLTPNEYAYTHTSPTETNNYYRIKQIDTDKKFSYSKIIAVKMENIDKNRLSFIANVFPNPAKDQLLVTFQTPINPNTLYQLIDLQGRVQQQYQFDNTETKVILPLPKMSAGLYILQITSENFTEKHKIYIQQ